MKSYMYYLLAFLDYRFKYILLKFFLNLEMDSKYFGHILIKFSSNYKKLNRVPG